MVEAAVVVVLGSGKSSEHHPWLGLNADQPTSVSAKKQHKQATTG